MSFWIATSNQGKFNEFKLLLEPLAVPLHSQRELTVFASPRETGQTYIDNARIKARALHAVQKSVWVMGDDSGIECEGLGNMPGVHSARYAGERASDGENIAKLLKMLQIRSSNRQAVMKATLVVISPQSEEFIFEGQMSGTIAKAPKGQHGFGYDPIFVPNGETQTLAELGSGFKAKHSHRAQAARQLVLTLSGQILHNSI